MVAIRQTHSSTFDFAKWVDELNLQDEQKDAIKKWAQFVSQYNRPLKEGLYTDFANKEDLSELIRFKSTADEGTGENNWTSFADYVQRMKTDLQYLFSLHGIPNQ